MATATTLADRLHAIEQSIETLSESVSNLSVSPFKVVSTLPDVASAVADVIYFVPSSATEEQNVYIEYALIEGAFEKVGEYTASIDLTQYATKEQLEDTNVALVQTINRIGAFKVSKNLDDLANLDTTAGSVAYYSYFTDTPIPVSSIEIGFENTFAAVGKFQVNQVMPTVSGNVVIQFESDPMSGDSMFIVTLQADESLTNLDAIIETGYGLLIPDYFWEAYNATTNDVEIDDELWTIHIIKDGVVTNLGHLMFNYFLSLSNRCYISEINCSDMTAFDNTLLFYGTDGVIPFELTNDGWRIGQAEETRRLDKIKLGFTRSGDSVVDYIDKVFNILKG